LFYNFISFVFLLLKKYDVHWLVVVVVVVMSGLFHFVS